jgi:hypothetical protein
MSQVFETPNSLSTRQFFSFSRNARSLQNTHTVQNKTSVDEKEPNEALQVKRSTSEFGDFSSRACFLLVRNFPILQNSEILLKKGVFIGKLFL